jgi:predicted TIM-barrel fold metal-dependent hydrolase
MYDPVAINNRATTGVETLMWGNDYPHPEGTWPRSQEVCAEQFADVPDDEFRAMVGGTAARVFGFEMAVPA